MSSNSKQLWVANKCDTSVPFEGAGLQESHVVCMVADGAARNRKTTVCHQSLMKTMLGRCSSI